MPEPHALSLDFTLDASVSDPNALPVDGRPEDGGITVEADDGGAMAVDAVPPSGVATGATGAKLPVDSRVADAGTGTDAGTGPRPLKGSGQNTMALHTREAWWLFHGKRWNPDGNVSSIVGGRRFAWAVRAIWILSGNDNPYADWMLIRIDRDIADLRLRLQAALEGHRARIDLLQSTGMQLSLLESSAPQFLVLEFQSPYGYATAALIHAFDAYVRTVKTLVYTDQLSDGEGRRAVREFASPMRGLFALAIPWQRLLWRDALRTHSRRDFLPDADGSARSRVATLTQKLGCPPPEVLVGSKAPRHTRRRIRLTESELRALADAAQVLDADDGAATEGLL